MSIVPIVLKELVQAVVLKSMVLDYYNLSLRVKTKELNKVLSID